MTGSRLPLPPRGGARTLRVLGHAYSDFGQNTQRSQSSAKLARKLESKREVIVLGKVAETVSAEGLPTTGRASAEGGAPAPATAGSGQGNAPRELSRRKLLKRGVASNEQYAASRDRCPARLEVGRV